MADETEFALAMIGATSHVVRVKSFSRPQLQRFVFFLSAMVLCWLPVNAGDKKGKDVMLSFHMQTEMGNPKMTFELMVAGKKCYFSRMPDFSHRDVMAFRPFLGDNEDTYGVIFQLKDSSRNKLENLSTANRGKYLCATFNGRMVDAVMIDTTVTDGLLVIWNGITDAEIKALDKMAPRIGQKKK